MPPMFPQGQQATIKTGGDRSDNRLLGAERPQAAGTMDAHQADMKARNATIARIHGATPGPNPGRAQPASSSPGQPFKVSVGG